MLPKNSRQRLMYLWNVAMRLANLGQEPDIDDELVRSTPEKDRMGQWMLSYIRFIHYVETMQIEAAETALSCLSLDTIEASYYRQPLETYTSTLRHFRERWLPGRKRAKPEPDSLTKGNLPEWAETGEHLLLGHSERALAVAKRQAGTDANRVLRGASFSSFNLIRAELASRNAEAARSIVAQRQRKGNTHYLDDVFLARVELLVGNRDRAAEHFAVTIAACKKYGAEGRLNLELRMACEMTPGDLVALGAAAGRIDAGLAAPLRFPSDTPTEPDALQRIEGNSPALKRAREMIVLYAPLDVPVLVTGETGTGKELVARALHECGPRAKEPFVAVNCGAITESILASELFGHQRGAFTGAETTRCGLFEEARKGTLLLDEVGEMPASLQTALLRALETGEVRPVGANRTRHVNCRIVAATNAPLDRLVKAGRFRRDLFYRLQRAEILLPPLRGRKEDILALMNGFLRKGRPDGRCPIVSNDLQGLLSSHLWPGNVRELRNMAERMRLLGSEKLEYDMSDAGALLGNTESAVGTSRKNREEAGNPRDSDVVELLRSGRSKLRRVDRLRELFREHGKLTRAEAAQILGVSARTAGLDLKELCAEDLIEKVLPTAAPRSHYFILRESPQGGRERSGDEELEK